MAILFDGIAFGLQLSLLATGLTLVYGLGGVLNLAHGQLAVAGAVLGAVGMSAGWPLPLAVLSVAALPAVLLVVVDRTLLVPVYRASGEARTLAGLLVTLGVAFAIDGWLFATQAATRLSWSIPGEVVTIAGVGMRRNALAAAAIAAFALGLLALTLARTRTGLAVRAAIDDPVGAQLTGSDPARLRTLVMAISGLLAGVFALAEAVNASVGPDRARTFTVLALIVTVVGGLGSVVGALLAGLVLGLVYVTAQTLVGSFWTFVLLLLVAVLAILVRPAGLVGVAGSEP